MTAKNPKHGVKLKVEALESREVMAGNVSAYVQGSILYVLGDSSSNGVEIRQVSPDAFQVKGVPQGGSATKLNGSTAARTFSGVGDDVVVSLNQGHDRVNVLGQTNGRRSFVMGDLRVYMGSGNDGVYMNTVQTRGEVRVDTGSGQDWTSIDNVVTYLDMTIEDHAWNPGDRDQVWVYNSGIGYGSYKANLKVDLNTGNDQVYLNNTHASYMNVLTYGGEDYISVENCKIWTHLGRFSGGPGRDTLRLRGNAPHGGGLAMGIEVFS